MIMNRETTLLSYYASWDAYVLMFWTRRALKDAKGILFLQSLNPGSLLIQICSDLKWFSVFFSVHFSLYEIIVTVYIMAHCNGSSHRQSLGPISREFTKSSYPLKDAHNALYTTSCFQGNCKMHNENSSFKKKIRQNYYNNHTFWNKTDYSWKLARSELIVKSSKI